MTDPARLVSRGRSGVHRLAEGADLAAARRDAERAGWDVARIDGSRTTGKRAFLSAAATALRFPPGLGRNWDALEDALRDLSWRKGSGTLLLWSPVDPLAEGDPESYRVAVEVLRESAAWWRERDRPLLALLGGARRPVRRGAR
jgi:hypothetical protein